MKRIWIYLILCTAFFCCTLSAAVKVGKKGYSAAVSIADPGKVSGTILEKPQLFKLELKNSELLLTVFDKNGKTAVTLNADAGNAHKLAAVIQMERLYEKAQGLDGYRIALYVNGKRVSEVECTQLALSDTGAALQSAGNSPQEKDGAMNDHEIRQLSGILVPRRWRPSQKNATVLETSAMKMNIRTAAGKGNPVLGVYNKMTKSLAIIPGGISWSLQYRDAKGISRYLEPGDFSHAAPEITKGNDSYRIDILWKNDFFEVTSGIEIKGSRIESTMKAKSLDPGNTMLKVVFPRYRTLKLPGEDKVVVPRFSGCEEIKPTERLSYRAPWPGGNCTMQFTAHYNDREQGIYFGREDASGAVKECAVYGSGGLLETSWVVAVPAGVSEVELPGKSVIEFYKGTWFEAGQIYKKFVATTPWWIKDIPRKDTPKWFMDNAFWLINYDYLNSDYSVRLFTHLREFYDLPLALETGMLETTAGKWRFGPDFRIRKGFLNYIKDIQALGVRVGPYYNSRLCYAGETADQENNYSNTGKKYAVKSEFGTIRVEDYGRTGIHAVMCPGCPDWQKQLYANVERIASGGVDLIYHDQLPCGRPFACNADNHGHAVNDPYAWLPKGHWQTYARIKTELHAKYPELAHTGEDASEAFIPCIDGFMVWRFGKPGRVPLFQSIFAPRIQFVGRGCEVHGAPGTYESFFPKYGEQLVYNEQIGWAAMETLRYPSVRRNYLKKLAHLRLVSADFFNSAEMMAPLKFRTKPETMSCRWGIHDLANVTSDLILHGVWRHKDGRKMIVFLNTVNEKKSVEPIIGFNFKNMTALRESGETVTRYGKNLPDKVELEPYGAEFWFFDVKENDPDVAKIAKKLPYTAKIIAGDRGTLHQQRQNFGKVTRKNAYKSPVYAKDADWMLFAYRPTGKTIDHDPGSRYKPYTYSWIAASDGAVISYGETFIGKKSDGIEIEIACDQPGVKVEFVDISANHYDEILAEITPEAGEWFTFKKYKVKWKNPTTSALIHTAIRVKGGTCRIGAWQVIGVK